MPDTLRVPKKRVLQAGAAKCPGTLRRIEPSRWLFFALAIVLLTGTALGICYLHTELTIESATIDLNNPTNSNAVVLTHDFGVLRRAEKAFHRFAICNTSTIAWSVKRVEASCGCTIPHVSADHIMPGATEFVNIELTARNNVSDTKNAVLIRFKEKSAPTIYLHVSARVRDALTIIPDEIKFRLPATSRDHDAIVNVSNFGDTDWKSLVVTSSERWLHAKVIQDDRHLRPNSGRQQWQIYLRADRHSLNAGDYIANLQVSPFAQPNLAGAITVHLSVVSSLDIAPLQMFFGALRRADKRVTRNVVLQFLDEPQFHPRNVIVTTDLGSFLTTSLREQTARTWLLSATINPGQKPVVDQAQVFRGQVQVAFPNNNDIPLITIPIIGSISE